MIRLSPHHDLPALAAAYAAHGRLQVRDLMVPGDAEYARSLLMQTPWSLAFNEGSKVHRLSPEEQARLTPQQAAQLMAGVRQRASSQFQFLYDYDPVFVRYFAPGHPRMPSFEVYEFLNSPEMIAFFRALTGLDDIRWADGQATLYRPGHFLKVHDDINHQEKRRAAYVLNLTQGWQRDWGGYLQFFDANGDIEAGFRPTFNAVNVFTVPAQHNVETVASFATQPRLSLTGWLRADDPPGRFGRG
jgi:SM-20-related protein